MRGTLRVEPATPTDVDAIRELELGPSVARTVEDEVRSPQRTCLVARLDGEVVGAALGFLASDEGHVLDMAVARRVRRQGIGARLLAALEDTLLAAGATTMTLEVRPSNTAARGLYDRLGFREEGRRRGYYADGEDALVLWRRVPGHTADARVTDGPEVTR